MKQLYIAALLAVVPGCAVNGNTANCAPADHGVTACYEIDAADHQAGTLLSIRAERPGRSVVCDGELDVHGVQCDIDVTDGSPWLFQFMMAPTDPAQQRRALCSYSASGSWCLGDLNVFVDGEFVASFIDPPEAPFYYENSQPLTRLGWAP